MEAPENVTMCASGIFVPIHSLGGEPWCVPARGACQRLTNSGLGDMQRHLADEIPHSVVCFAEMAARIVAQVECGLCENGHFC